MNFHDSAFEKAYLAIIREDSEAQFCQNTDEDGNICGAELVDDGNGNLICPKCDMDESDECCNGSNCDECGDPQMMGDECGDPQMMGDEYGDPQMMDDDMDDNPQMMGDDMDPTIYEDDNTDADDTDDTTDNADADTDDTAEADNAGEGKFISFFTTDQGLIDALQNGFAKITVAFDDDKEDPAEFTADVFENLSVEDLKEDEGAEGAEDADADADADTDAEEDADADVDK